MKYNSIQLVQLDDVDFFEIVQQYREPHRIYHNYGHIESSNGNCDSFWLPNLITVLQAAEEWCNKKCIKNEDGSWSFKPGTKNMELKKINGNLQPRY
jgi:hypothetical protein